MVVDARVFGAPVEASAGHCCLMLSQGYKGAPQSCNGTPVATADVSFSYDGAVWRVFLCAQHAAMTNQATPLTDATRAELKHRRDRHAAALAGRRIEPLRPLQPGRR